MDLPLFLRTVCWASLAVLAGCSYDAELATYCERYGACECSGDDCCVVRKSACTPGLCCPGLYCNRSGVCTDVLEFASVPPRGSPNSSEHHLVRTGEPKTVYRQLLNKNTEGSAALTFRGVGDTTHFLLKADACEGKSLPAGEMCSVSVTFEEGEPNDVPGTLQIEVTDANGLRGVSAPLDVQ